MTEDSKTNEVTDTEEVSETPIRKISEHAFFDNGRLLLKDHPDTAKIQQGIAYATKIANIRMKENEELILMQVEKRLDPAFYTLWCREANSFFRLSLRYRRRAAQLAKTEKSTKKEPA